jgi:antirestriction protein ArdC
LHNQLLAWAQCVDRGINPGPLHTFAGWLSLGRHVRRGEKALVLCVPVTVPVAEPDSVDETPAVATRQSFVYRARWFALCQTDGDEYEPVGTPDWHEGRALKTLGVQLVAFEHLDGNTQGYALPGRQIAINPVAALPHKTLFHELGHVLLGHPEDEKTPRAVKEAEAEAIALLCIEALDLPGTEYARGYLQNWLRGTEFSDDSSQRIITTAQEILAAGALDGPPL